MPVTMSLLMILGIPFKLEIQVDRHFIPVAFAGLSMPIQQIDVNTIHNGTNVPHSVFSAFLQIRP